MKERDASSPEIASKKAHTASWDSLEMYADQEKLENQFPNLGSEWARKTAEQRTRDLRTLREAEQLGNNTTNNRAFLTTLWEKEDRKFAEWNKDVINMRDDHATHPKAISRLEAITTIATALSKATPKPPPYGRPVENLGERVRKKIKRAIESGHLPCMRLGRPLSRTARLDDDDMLPLKPLIEWVRKEYPNIPPPWSYRQRITAGITTSWGSRKSSGLPDFSRDLITLAGEKHLGELRRMMDYIQAMEAEKAQCARALRAERETVRQLKVELDDAKQRLARPRTGRPRNKQNLADKT
jgi:hypothetical protein